MTARGYRGAVLGAVLVFAGALGGVPVVSGSSVGVGVVVDGAGTVTTDVAAAVSDSGMARVAMVGSDDNEAPLADAGLDQEVPVNATVYLDASGSRDPDGSIDSYEWSVERPDGHIMEPGCADCARTEFQVRQNGTYEVTVTVTDDDGATSSDTLYVEAIDVDGPTVELSGPRALAVNATGTYTATAEAGDSPLMKIEWELDGSEMADSGVGGESATDDHTVDFDSETHRLTVRVVSERGRTDVATLTVDVSDRPPRPCEAATWNGTAGWWDVGPCGDDGDDGGDAESCYDAQSDRAREWEKNHPNKEFACYNDVWFGGNSPSIVDTNENNWFVAKGIQVSKVLARNWTNHPDVTLTTKSGFDRLNFHTQEVWKNTKRNNDPWDDEKDDNGDERDDGNNDDEDGSGDKISCYRLPDRIQHILDRCD